MAARTALNRKSWPLIAVCLVVAVLLLLLATLERSGEFTACSAELPPGPPEPEPTALSHTPAVALDPLPKTMTESPTSLAAAPKRATVVGHVVDSNTGEPVPWIEVRLSLGGRFDSVVTEVDGGFSSDIEDYDGELLAEVRDEGTIVGRATREHATSTGTLGWEIRVAIGPTLYFGSIGNDRPAEKELWRARIVESGFPFGSSGELDVRGTRLAVDGSTETRPWPWQKMRFVGDEAFVRWPRIAYKPDRAFFPTLIARSDATYTESRSELRTTVGVTHLPHVPASKFSVVTGRIRIEPANATHGNVRLLVYPETSETQDFVEASVGASEYSIEVHGTGHYVVAAWAEGLRPRAEPVTLEGGTRGVRDIVLQPFQSEIKAKKPSLRIVGEIGTARQFLRARMDELGRFTPAWTFDLGSSTVDLTGVPPAEYTLEAVGCDEEPSFRRVFRKQVLPTTMVDGRGAGAKASPYRIEPTSARGQGASAGLVVTAGPTGCLFSTKPLDVSRTWNFSGSQEFHFTVWGTDACPVDLESDDFRREDGVEVARPNLKPGWGVQLAFRIGDPKALEVSDGSERARAELPGAAIEPLLTMPALAGATVSWAGGRTTPTQEDGVLLVTDALWPIHLTLNARGWRLCALEEIPGPGSRWVVWMVREP